MLNNDTTVRIIIGLPVPMDEDPNECETVTILPPSQDEFDESPLLMNFNVQVDVDGVRLV